MNDHFQSDALVLFGATGDLARRKSFPRCTTCCAMVARCRPSSA